VHLSHPQTFRKSLIKNASQFSFAKAGSLRINLLEKKVLSKTSFFGQAFFLKERLRVNRTGGILTPC
jgi:hypothetical protein